MSKISAIGKSVLGLAPPAGLLAAIAAIAMALELAGLGVVRDFIAGLPFWQRLAVSALLWGAALLVCLRLPRLLRAVVPWLGKRLAAFALAAAGIAWRAIAAMMMPVMAVIGRIAAPYWMGLRLALLPLAAPVSRITRGVRAAIAWARELDFSPVAGAWRRVAGAARYAVALWRAWREDWTLWRVYRAEFREAFASYREFKAALAARMYAGDQGSQESAPAPREAFAAACEAMGLPADGAFSEAVFKARYRALMKDLHPDVAGPNDRAAEVNAASMLIRKRKGWS
ncbi:hypothetical protein [Hyphomicrobium sp. MC8b]|uniref:hypothetical protein n=1 Tax=Hyphomicrobium sp. MC8b TaxID=300273 RepID=UPI00391C65F7